MAMPEEFAFSSLRIDWYRSNQCLPRVIRQCVDGKRHLVFKGFPRQWIPLFVWFGVAWKETTDPADYLPFFSDFGESQMKRFVCRARKRGMLRPMLEAVCTLDPVVCDCL